MPRLSRGAAYMVIAALAFSVMSALVKVVGATVPATEVVFARSLVGLVLTFWMLRRAGVAPFGNRRGLLTVRGLFGFAGLLCYFYALTELPLADATVIMYTNPVWTAVLAGIFLRERVSRHALVASAVALVGVVLVARPTFIFGGAGLPLVPVLVALVGAVCAGSAYVAVRALRTTEHALVVVLFFPLIATPASIPLMAPEAVWPDLRELALLLGVGVAVQVAQVFMTRGLHLEPAGRATGVSYVQVAFAYMWGMIVFDEVPTPLGLAGAALIVGAALSLAIRRGDPGPTPPADGATVLIESSSAGKNPPKA